MKSTVPFSLLLLLASLPGVRAEDWPQWRGPTRNGISRETGLLKQWPKEGPKLVWKISDAGKGYSTPAVVGDRIYLLGNQGLENEFVQARGVADGMVLWSQRLGKVGNPNQQPSFPGARSTPTVEGDAIYVLGSDGDLACLEKASGRPRWQKSLRSDFGGKPGEWAYSESPLIDGETLICTPGAPDAAIVALNKKTGAVIWKCAIPEGGTAAYASPIVIEAGGVRQYVQLLQKGLVGVEAKTGKFLWRYGKATSRYGANIPSPVADNGYIYTSAAGTGGGVIKLKGTGPKFDVEEVFFASKFPTTIGGSVKVGNLLFGTTDKALLCTEFTSGKIQWEMPLGPASLCHADGRLYVHAEKGDVLLVEALPDSFSEKGRFMPPDRPGFSSQMEQAWAYPVVANGKLYIREHAMLWCYNIKAGGN